MFDILGIVLLFGFGFLLFLIGLVFLYIFLRKGNVKVQIWRVNNEGDYIERKMKTGVYDEKKSKLTILKGLLGKVEVEDFPSSTIKADRIIDVIEYNGEYIPAYFNIEKQVELKATPLLDPARRRALAERIRKNEEATKDISKTNFVSMLSVGAIIILLIANIVMTQIQFSNFSNSVKEFNKGVESLNAKIVIQPQPITSSAPQQENENKPPG